MTPHAPLKGEQRSASDPAEHVWLSASAGTGKTYVLTARVLRLLLRGVRPDSILCLTFTKAGAAEMAERVHERLAWWVRLDGPRLATELKALDEDFGPACVGVARTLFARVLEARGGGLRIMTIHAFCQTLLAGFPVEAGLTPGFRPIEGREESALARSVLGGLVVQAEREGDVRLLGDLSSLSNRLGEDEARRFLMHSSAAGDALEMLPSGLEGVVRQALKIPLAFDAGHIPAACGDDAVPREALLELARMHSEWGTKTGEAAAGRVGEWLLGTPAQRAAELEMLGQIWLTQDGAFRKGGPKHPDYAVLVERLHDWCGDLCALAKRAELAKDVTSALEAARRYARAYADAKRVRGLVDFNDLIRMTGKLLADPGIGDWIRYKLDMATDHILIDEAQDTNLAQWEIIAGLAGEYFAGEGARDASQRTLFTVGDFKQAIFGFQGTDPVFYQAAGRRFEMHASDAGRALLQLSLNRSFRSSQPVLDIVDKCLEELGSDTLGLLNPTVPHVSSGGGFGEVLLLQPLTGECGDDEGEEGWIEDHVRTLAGAIARQVKAWLAEPLWLAGKGRSLRPADVMILVRRRGELASLLVARLQAEGVAVAGVDRLRLKAPLAIKDLLAAMRFAVQRDDDLSLAALLVSPLFGWSQDDLFAIAYGRKRSLWEAVSQGDTREALLAILNAADRTTPFGFLEQMLSGPLQGRRKLIARLGEEARDPIDELLNAAIAFGHDATGSLQGFIDWFDGHEGEIVRDAGGAGDAVRVMTVHGAKGLQAPLVVLADAASDPDAGGGRGFDWLVDGLDKPVPLFRPRAAERSLVDALQARVEEVDARERREHWRLLYVAMTRAEERLVVTGSLGPRAKGVVPGESWHTVIGRAMAALGIGAVADPDWGARWTYGNEAVVRKRPLNVAQPVAEMVARPDWLDRAAPVEARPPRPLAPSSLGLDDVADVPAAPALRAAAVRGRLLHALFERLPGVAVGQRRAAGLRWLAGAGGVADADERERLVSQVLDVVNDAHFASVFGVAAMAEVPVAGVAEGVVIAGTIDRLVVTPERVEIVDFKTGKRVPRALSAVPEHHLRQMAAYAAVIAGIFPGRAVTAALLYTEGPVIHRLSAELLERYKPGFIGAEDYLAVSG